MSKFSHIKYLVTKIDHLERLNEQYLDDVIAYREWFVINEDKLRTLALTAPPFNKAEEKKILNVLHAKYCTDCIVEE